MFKFTENIKFLDIKEISDLKLAMEYISNFEENDLVDSIMDNPSLLFFEGLNSLISYINDPMFVFLFDIKENNIIAFSKDRSHYAVLTYAKKSEVQDKAFRVHFYYKKKRLNYSVNISKNDDSIDITVYNNISMVSPYNGFEFHIFNKSGLEEYYLCLLNDYLSIIRNPNGYTATVNYSGAFGREFVGDVNIDTNYPLVTYSNGKVINSRFVRALKRKKVSLIDESDIDEFIENNTKYLADETRAYLLGLITEDIKNKKQI